MSFLASLSPEARNELRAFVAVEVAAALAARERNDGRQEWLTTQQTAELLGKTPNAIRCRVNDGWLTGDVAREGRRLFIRRSAVLDLLERNAQR